MACRSLNLNSNCDRFPTWKIRAPQSSARFGIATAGLWQPFSNCTIRIYSCNDILWRSLCLRQSTCDEAWMFLDANLPFQLQIQISIKPFQESALMLNELALSSHWFYGTTSHAKMVNGHRNLKHGGYVLWTFGRESRLSVAIGSPIIWITRFGNSIGPCVFLREAR